MAYVQPADISSILNAFSQLGQANSLERQRKDAAAAQRASTLGALGSLGGGIAAGVATGGNPYAAAAGAAAGGRILGGERVGGAQMIQGAGQAYQMAQQQQAYEAQQADRASISRAADYLNPQPTVTSTGNVNLPARQVAFPEEGGAITEPARSVGGEMAITPGARNVPGAISELIRGGQIGPAVSLMAALQKDADKGFTLGKDQARYDAQGNLIVERTGSGEDDPSKTEFERSLIAITNAAVSRGDLTKDQATEFKDNIRRQKFGLPSLTPGGATLPALDVDAAIASAKAATPGTRSETPKGPVDKPLGPAQQEAIQHRAESRKLLDIMQNNISRTGRVAGFLSEAGAWLGVDKGSIEFNIARDKNRLALQSTIKGIPSDADQALIDRLQPSLTDPPEVVATKIRIQREALERADKGEFDYLKENRFAIPKELEKAAKRVEEDQKRRETIQKKYEKWGVQ